MIVPSATRAAVVMLPERFYTCGVWNQPDQQHGIGFGSEADFRLGKHVMRLTRLYISELPCEAKFSMRTGKWP